jgi:exosortase/archaeosortase
VTGTDSPTREPRRTRDALAALLILAGGAGLVVAAFAVSVLLGCAVVSAMMLCAGLLLGVER